LDYRATFRGCGRLSPGVANMRTQWRILVKVDVAAIILAIVALIALFH
jgi:hypothetical protein